MILDEAWAAVVEAMPWRWTGPTLYRGVINGQSEIAVFHRASVEYVGGASRVVEAVADTPEAALIMLAAKLRDMPVAVDRPTKWEVSDEGIADRAMQAQVARDIRGKDGYPNA